MTRDRAFDDFLDLAKAYGLQFGALSALPRPDQPVEFIPAPLHVLFELVAGLIVHSPEAAFDFVFDPFLASVEFPSPDFGIDGPAFTEIVLDHRLLEPPESLGDDHRRVLPNIEDQIHDDERQEKHGGEEDDPQRRIHGEGVLVDEVRERRNRRSPVGTLDCKTGAD